MQNNMQVALSSHVSDPLQSRSLRNLRNTRDFRAEILSLAAALAADAQAKGRLQVVDSAIAKATIRKEWDRMMPAIAAEVRARMTLAVDKTEDSAGKVRRGAEGRIVPLDKPNYRFEVLRLLLGADLEDDGPQLFKNLLEKIGASQTPIREALKELKQASGIVYGEGRGVQARVEDVSMELLAKVGALPQTLRFRYERGARLKPPAELLKRVEPLLGLEGPESWKPLALSGSPVAGSEVPSLNLIGIPRLDLLMRVSRDERTLNTELVRLLDDGLELEPNVLAPAPVVMTLVRADARFDRGAGLSQMRCASRVDVLLSLLDMGLREQALQYAREVQP